MSSPVARLLLRQTFARSEARRRTQLLPIGSPIACVQSSSSFHSFSAQQQQCLTSRRPSTAPVTRPPSASLAARTFHSSPATQKKKDRRGRGAEAEEEEAAPSKSSKSSKASKPSKNSKSAASQGTTDAAADDADDADGGPKHPQPDPENPLDFADVKSRLDKHAERFKSTFKKLHTGGRFDADVIGSLQVKTGGQTASLRDLAQVVPRPGGRSVSILVHEEAHIKPIMSAVQSSADFNQQPQRATATDPDANPLELTLKIEMESRDEQVKRVKATAHEWRERVRAVRQKRDKVHSTWAKEKALGPDAKRGADKELEKVIKAAVAVVDAAEKDALKTVEKK